MLWQKSLLFTEALRAELIRPVDEGGVIETVSSVPKLNIASLINPYCYYPFKKGSCNVYYICKDI